MSTYQHALYDSRNGDPALVVADLFAACGRGEPTRTNCFATHHVQSGSGTFWVDEAACTFTAPCLLFSSPYQAVRFDVDTAVSGTTVLFHANFLCVETYHHEVGCNGVLFNDPYGLPVVTLDERQDTETAALIAQMRLELTEAGLAHAEALVSFLKIFLVRAARLKREQQGSACGPDAGKRPPLLDELRDLIEVNYRTQHAPADYAERLHTTPKTLGRLVKTHLGKTLTDLIRDRVLQHAKWELLHTLRPIKEIARELGYDDELYFSRLFRKATGLSPTHFREFETAIRGGRNLSMPSAPASIPPTTSAGQNAVTPASGTRKKSGS